MYYDRRRIENREQQWRYLVWKRAVLDLLGLVPDARLVVLEIGCGTNVRNTGAHVPPHTHTQHRTTARHNELISAAAQVSTVRLESEEVLARSCGEEGESRGCLVRINLEYPKCHWRPHLQERIVSIQATATNALRQIDAHLRPPGSEPCVS